MKAKFDVVCKGDNGKGRQVVHVTARDADGARSVARAFGMTVLEVKRIGDVRVERTDKVSFSF